MNFSQKINYHMREGIVPNQVIVKVPLWRKTNVQEHYSVICHRNKNGEVSNKEINKAEKYDEILAIGSDLYVCIDKNDDGVVKTTYIDVDGNKIEEDKALKLIEKIEKERVTRASTKNNAQNSQVNRVGLQSNGSRISQQTLLFS